jgi:glycogen synthase
MGSCKQRYANSDDYLNNKTTYIYNIYIYFFSLIVGGIYTVIRTKAPVTVHEFGDRYTLIGPLFYKTAVAEVEPEEVPNPYMKEILGEMSLQGVRWTYGRWLIEGGPHVLLFDTASVSTKLEGWKADLWKVAGIPSPPNDQETNDAILFGYLVNWFLSDVSII